MNHSQEEMGTNPLRNRKRISQTTEHSASLWCQSSVLCFHLPACQEGKRRPKRHRSSPMDYLFIYPSIYLPIYLSVYPSIPLSISIYPSTYPYVCIYLPTYLPIYLPTYLYTYLSIHLSLHPSTYLSSCQLPYQSHAPSFYEHIKA